MKIEVIDNAVMKDGQQVGSIEGDRCILYTRPSPQMYPAIKRAAGNENLKFDILPENQPPKGKKDSVPNGGPGEPVTGAGLSPHETRNAQAEGGFSDALPPPPATPRGSWVDEKGITHIPVATAAEEGWVNDKTLRVFRP